MTQTQHKPIRQAAQPCQGSDHWRGCDWLSIAYHLAKLGWKDVIILEQTN